MRIDATLLAKFAWLIWFFVLSALHLSFAQESPTASQENSVPPGSKDEALRDRPVIKQFGAQPMTLEEQEACSKDFETVHVERLIRWLFHE